MTDLTLFLKTSNLTGIWNRRMTMAEEEEDVIYIRQMAVHLSMRKDQWQCLLTGITEDIYQKKNLLRVHVS